jgi:predicted nuclease of predicted toxin-antitoxin system
MKLLIDMNLPPAWVAVLEDAGHEAVHWSQVGDPRAADVVLMQYARDHGLVVFTHDLDFGALLAASGVDSPSVVQARTQNVMPEVLAVPVLEVLESHAAAIEAGALIVIDETVTRVRILPLKRPGRLTSR